MVNWEEPQKQSAVGIFLFAAKNIREAVGALVVIIGSSMRKDKSLTAWLVMVGCVVLYIFGRAILDYLYFRFYILENQLIIKKGLFAKKTVVIPFERIQTVQLEQSLFHRIIQHYRVSIDTAGSEKTEVSIHALAYNKALSLKQVLTQQSISSPVQEEVQEKIIRLSPRDLFNLAISHNHIETVGLIFAFVLAQFNNIKDLFDIDAYDYLEKQGHAVTVTTQVIGILIFIAIAFAILISFIRIVLKYSDLQISLTEKGFNLRHGLLHSKQQFIGTNKIQYLQWSANWIRRKIGMYIFRVKIIGEDELKAKQKIQVPITRKEHLEMLAVYYQTKMPSAEAPANNIQPAYVSRTTLLIGVPITVALVIGFYFAIEWWCLLFGLWLVYYHFRNVIYKNNFRFWVNEDAIELSTGVWGRQRVILNWHKLQVVTIQQSIYQRKKQLANLILRTASGDVTIPYITLEEAQVISDFAMMQTESSQRRWM